MKKLITCIIVLFTVAGITPSVVNAAEYTVNVSGASSSSNRVKLVKKSGGMAITKWVDRQNIQKVGEEVYVIENGRRYKARLSDQPGYEYCVDFGDNKLWYFNLNE